MTDAICKYCGSGTIDVHGQCEQCGDWPEPAPPPPAPSDGLVEASVYASAVKGRADFRAAYREARARITELEAKNSEVWEKWKGLRDDCIKCETKLSDIEDERDAALARITELEAELERTKHEKHYACNLSDLLAKRIREELEPERAALSAHVKTLREALELPLIFHAGSPWTIEKQDRWKEITGEAQSTTKVMCDHIRSALASTEPKP